MRGNRYSLHSRFVMQFLTLYETVPAMLMMIILGYVTIETSIPFYVQEQMKKAKVAQMHNSQTRP